MAKKKRVKAEPKASKKFESKKQGFFHNISEFIVNRINLKQRIEDAKEEVAKILMQLKREVIRTIIESVFLVTGLISLIIGLIMLINNHYPLEYVLLGYGLIVTIVVMMTMKLRRE